MVQNDYIFFSMEGVHCSCIVTKCGVKVMNIKKTKTSCNLKWIEQIEYFIQFIHGVLIS